MSDVSLRSNPPPAPGARRRQGRESFALLESADGTRTWEVSFEYISVGGVWLDFVSIPPPESILGQSVNVFVDVGPDMEGERVAGTLAAELVLLQKSKRGKRALLMWSGREMEASLLVNRLLTQQYAASWEELQRAA